MNATKIEELKALAGRQAPQEIVRGWEITRGNGIPTGMKYAPTFMGASQCAADVKWLQARHPTKGYDMRALVSVARPSPETQELEGPSEQAVDEAEVVGLDPMIAAELEAATQEQDAGE